ncbi:hypothetical protein HW532_06785 [Kaustia mangrovi]|uniref:Uncharacterized protein n=1 Tax=Kaustia mangrovi TaxID=2593653 RepID=A0A7S8C337_9HYPH|nr:hypothetical protein [Kaustia mangrovi]QPC42437.1 hypothetical protein HW532_06785 [Kaustia mangrovi]
MNKRVLMAIGTATMLVAGLALLVTPGETTKAEPQTVTRTSATHTLTAYKNSHWPVQGRVTTNPCSLAECRDA